MRFQSRSPSTSPTVERQAFLLVIWLDMPWQRESGSRLTPKAHEGYSSVPLVAAKVPPKSRKPARCEPQGIMHNASFVWLMP